LPMDPDSESGSTKSLNPDPQPCKFKRIVSRDFGFFLCHSIDLKFLHIRSGFICFQNFVFVSSFLIFLAGRSELRIVQILIMYRMAPDSIMEPRTRTVSSSLLFRQTSICVSAVMGS
jgi:hypothetical protein